jgi:hypothetical protein
LRFADPALSAAALAKKRESISAKKWPFGSKKRAFGVENGVKYGFCSYQSVNREKYQTVDSL